MENNNESPTNRVGLIVKVVGVLVFLWFIGYCFGGDDKQNWECHCKGNKGVMIGTSSVKELNDLTREEAEKKCGGGLGYECVLIEAE